MSDLPTRAVISAVHHLGDRNGPGVWPTVDDVATYLRMDAEPVRLALLELRKQRIFCDRQRQGQRVWMPWNQS